MTVSVAPLLSEQTSYHRSLPLTNAAPLVSSSAALRDLASNNPDASRLHHILQCLPSGVILLDSRGMVVEANQVAIAMLGEPLLGQRWLAVITRCFRPRSDDGLEVSLADGRRLKIAISALAPQAGQLSQAGQVIVLTDLTETRELQHRVSHLQRLSTLGKMMATLAHQIRTPLSSALLYAENLNSPKLTTDARTNFQQKLIARLNDLEQQVNDMLLFARSGTAQAVEVLSVQALCDEWVSRSEALLLQHKARLTISLHTPQLQLLGNKNSLVEALLNLLQNSVQAVGHHASIHLEQGTTNNNQLLLRFSDNGPGIAADIQAHIFEPFFSRKAGGTGLGLAVVQAVLHSHQGQVRYLNQAARAGEPQGMDELTGACFELVLPVYALPDTPYTAETAAPASNLSATTALSSLSAGVMNGPVLSNCIRAQEQHSDAFRGA